MTKNDIKTLEFLKKKHDESFKIREHLINNSGTDDIISKFILFAA